MPFPYTIVDTLRYEVFMLSLGPFIKQSFSSFIWETARGHRRLIIQLSKNKPIILLLFLTKTYLNMFYWSPVKFLSNGGQRATLFLWITPLAGKSRRVTHQTVGWCFTSSLENFRVFLMNSCTLWNKVSSDQEYLPWPKPALWKRW